MNAILSKSRYLIILAVMGTLVGMIALMIFGLWEIYNILVLTVSNHDQKDIGKQLTFAFIEVIDTFLIATVCYITALGLYELFIDDA
ncbi:MAG: YqhA family protein, partial [Roseiflexaceae bacterium]